MLVPLKIKTIVYVAHFCRQAVMSSNFTHRQNKKKEKKEEHNNNGIYFDDFRSHLSVTLI